MAKKNSRAQDEVDGKVNLSPMIDCCFLLLIFFVVNATQITVAKDPSVKMPRTVTSSEMKDANGAIVVNIFADPDTMEDVALKKYQKAYPVGSIWGTSNGSGGGVTGYLEGQTSELKEYINKKNEEYKAKNMPPEKIRLYLRGDMMAPWSRTSKVIELAASVGVTNIVFGTINDK